MKPRAAHPWRPKTSCPRFRGGFTLVEVLITLLFIGIVLPAVMKGITISGSLADTAHHRTEAAGLADSQLAQIVAAGTWQNGSQSGDFPDWPEYSWQSSVAPWPGDTLGAGLQEIDLKVSWKERGHDASVTLTTLAYTRTAPTQTQ